LQKLTDLDVFSLAVITIPQNKPKSWDAADCIVKNASISRFIKDNSSKIIFRPALNILDWNVDRCIGPVQKQKVLADCLLPLGVTSIVAALALKAASGTDKMCGFGPLVTEHGSVVIFSTEDDADEIHRRLERLDPESERIPYQNLYCSCTKCRRTILYSKD
jgi:hypothetical protein